MFNVTFNPQDWYWLADDARVYSSARQIIVDNTDADYVAWAATRAATPWPRDDAGDQTDDALQDVLAPYNLFANLTYYSADARYRRENSGVTVASIGGTVPFASDVASRNAVDTAWGYMNAKGTTNSISWKMSDGSFITMSTAQVTTLMTDMSTFIQGCFECENANLAAISGGTITTREQIDAAFAAIQSAFP